MGGQTVTINMKLLLGLFALASVHGAQDCIICTAEQVVKSKFDSSATPKTNGKSPGENNNCFSSSPSNSIFPEENCEKCFEVFYAVKGSNDVEGDFEILGVQRGCMAPDALVTQECTDNNGCSIDLNEENFGNYGTIKALSYTNTGSGKAFTNGGPDAFSTIDLKCHQCEGWEEDNECYKANGAAGQCTNLNATSCYSTVSKYSVEDEDGKEETYTYAKRGCATMSSEHAKESTPRQYVGNVFEDPADEDSAFVLRQMETTFCSGSNGCNTATMDYTSYSSASKTASFVIATLTAFFLH